MQQWLGAAGDSDEQCAVLHASSREMLLAGICIIHALYQILLKYLRTCSLCQQKPSLSAAHPIT